MTDGPDPLKPVKDLGDVIDTALDEVLHAAQSRMIAAIGTVTNALGEMLDDETLSRFHQVEWQLLHIANIGTVANLARRRMCANPDRIAEIATEARQLVDWNVRLAAEPPQFMPHHLIPRIGMHPDPDDTWENMMNTMLARRMYEDDGEGTD
jgi:hypothetical protein